MYGRTAQGSPFIVAPGPPNVDRASLTRLRADGMPYRFCGM